MKKYIRININKNKIGDSMDMENLREAVEQVEEFVRNGQLKEAKDFLAKYNYIDIADILEPLDNKTTLLLFRMLPKDEAVDVFARFSREEQTNIIQAITDDEVNEIINALNFDDRIDLLEEVPANITNKVLKYATKDERDLVNKFLNYPQESAGSLMTIEYIDLTDQMTVGEALDHIKEVGLDTQLIYTCYVLDPKSRRLEGYVSMRKLVTSERDVKIVDIMETNVITVNSHDDQEEVAGLFSRYGFVAMPVLDNEERMVGIITVDDIMSVIEQETTEDFEIMAGVSPQGKGYLEASAWQLVKNRLPWLLILMISATFTGRIMTHYENILAAHVILSSFIPMLMDTGGNSGSQSSTLIIRGLALKQIELRDFIKVFWKEFRIGFLAGIILSAINFARLLLIEQVPFSIALTVSVTLIFVIVLSKSVGGMLPMIAEKLGFDPAIMAGPLITTIVDALSLIVYFMIASKMLNI